MYVYVCIYIHPIFPAPFIEKTIHLSFFEFHLYFKYIQKKRVRFYFKKLAHAIVDTGKSKSASQASRLETQGRVDIAALI